MIEFQIRTQIDSLEIKLRKVAMRFFEMKQRLDSSLKENEELRKMVIETQKENQDLHKKLAALRVKYKDSETLDKMYIEKYKVLEANGKIFR